VKRLTTLFLVGTVVVLAIALAGVLLYVRSQPAPARAVAVLVPIAPMEPDSSQWGISFPNQWSTLQKTETNAIDTTFGGSSGFSWLERDPRQRILFAGYPFSVDYNDDRGHMNSLVDVRATGRLNLDREDPKRTPGTCYSCKSSDNPALWDELGMADYDATFFEDLGKRISNPIGCANCHDAETMQLIVTNPALDEALSAQGRNWKDFTRQEMRTVVCANCHVEYYFAGKGKYLTFPWEEGTSIEQIVAYYEEDGFTDWEYPGASTPMLKAQHPEYEFFTAGSTHFNAGVACADCHMPYVRDGAAKFSSHDVHSPLLNPEEACGQCHTSTEEVLNRVNTIQDQVSQTKLSTEDALIDAIRALTAANSGIGADPDLLDQARALHRRAQFMWDFVSAENSTGFHNPEYALKILAEAANLARQAQMLAAQAADNVSLLESNTYSPPSVSATDEAPAQ